MPTVVLPRMVLNVDLKPPRIVHQSGRKFTARIDLSLDVTMTCDSSMVVQEEELVRYVPVYNTTSVSGSSCGAHILYDKNDAADTNAGPDAKTEVPIGVFKPADEEAKLDQGGAVKKGIELGDAGKLSVWCLSGVCVVWCCPSLLHHGSHVFVRFAVKKEVAAFVLDHGHFAGVPITVPRTLSLENGKAADLGWQVPVLLDDLNMGHSRSVDVVNGAVDLLEEKHALPVEKDADKAVVKYGSLQKFEPHKCSAEDMGPSKFDLEAVQRIAALDMRIMNLDRHEGNLLCRDPAPSADEEAEQQGSGNNDAAPAPKLTLVPIDHSFSMPHFRQTEDVWFCWSSWPQARVPFVDSVREYIHALEPWRDVPTLTKLGVRREEILTYVLSSCILKRAVARDLLPFECANIFQRTDFDAPSVFESIVERAADESGIGDTFQWHDKTLGAFLVSAMDLADAHIEEICKKKKLAQLTVA